MKLLDESEQQLVYNSYKREMTEYIRWTVALHSTHWPEEARELFFSCNWTDPFLFGTETSFCFLVIDHKFKVKIGFLSPKCIDYLQHNQIARERFLKTLYETFNKTRTDRNSITKRRDLFKEISQIIHSCLSNSNIG